MQIRNYEVKEQIAKGGMGEIYRAMHPTLNKEVVIKKLMARSKKSIDLFTNEARLMIDFQCENIVNFYDHFEKGGNYYIVLEYVEGMALDELSGGKPLPLAPGLLIFKNILKGILYAHKKGIIHQDIKPANVLLSLKGEIKVSDFGISSVKDEIDGKKGGDTISGTPAFMAPELFSGSRNATEFSDIYALGCLLFTLFTGQTPFANSMGAANIAAIKKGRRRKLKIEAPWWVQRMIKKMMRINPNHRYINVSDVLRKLERKLKTRDEIEEQTIIRQFVSSRAGEVSGTAREMDLTMAASAGKKTEGKSDEYKGLVKAVPLRVVAAVTAGSAVLILAAVIFIFKLYFKPPLNKLPFIAKNYGKISLTVFVRNIPETEDMYKKLYFARRETLKNEKTEYRYRPLTTSLVSGRPWYLFFKKKTVTAQAEHVFNRDFFGRAGRYNFILLVNDKYYLVSRNIHPFSYRPENRISMVHNQKYFEYQSFNINFAFYNSRTGKPVDLSGVSIMVHSRKQAGITLPFKLVRDKFETGKMYVFDFYADGFRPLEGIPVHNSYFQREGEINIFLDPK
ncbi:MAG: hypothetical protein A2096_12340 [Spirochaetes bacterium GWF1_41_5]|nr:MAG: hypothetical protein A2096_12340 [Spirochaetes bacterium GWF1_41_5]HBE04518.1 hypothetical protein [Spirochaetia bacterium]